MAKKALVTGASEGIGYVFAKRLAAEGYEVTAVARNEVKLKSLTEALGGKHNYLVADLSTKEGQERVANALTVGRFDLLVNNAGVGTAGTFTEVALEKQLAMLRLNCEAVVRLCYAFLEKAKSGDALINVSSTLAFLPMPGLGLYSATKSFVTAFSETLWYEQKDKGVFVMDLCPGITSTAFQTNAGGKSFETPKSLTQTPEVVVENAIRGLNSRKHPTLISGSKNSMFASLSRLMSRRSTVSVMARMGATK